LELDGDRCLSNPQIINNFIGWFRWHNVTFYSQQYKLMVWSKLATILRWTTVLGIKRVENGKSSSESTRTLVQWDVSLAGVRCCLENVFYGLKWPSFNVFAFERWIRPLVTTLVIYCCFWLQPDSIAFFGLAVFLLSGFFISSFLIFHCGFEENNWIDPNLTV